ncbi:MAG: hypothetical protein A2X45_22415 [Lentisphaerae bacterium GWF2_50_93]|nr:MAG: hypothetical protein A2X45_22415 [Lentisphaerae bacterium GWF2_50_93]
MAGVESGRPFQASVLRNFSTEILERAGVPSDEAAIVADSMIESNMRGLDTHGVTRLLPIYVARIQAGVMEPRARITIERDRPACILLDAHNSLGQVAARRAMELAIGRAQKMGTSLVGARNMNHYGASSCWTMMALAHDQIGFSTCNTPPFVPPTGGKKAIFGTNPFSFAIPGGDEGPIVVDMATTTVARGRIALYEKQGLPIPEGWGLDRDGIPTKSAEEAMKGFLQFMAGYKGYGISLVIDTLSGLLTGALFGMHVGGPIAEDLSRPSGFGAMFGAVSIDAFMDVSEFKTRMDTALREIRNSERAPGVKRIYVPGEQSAEKAVLRRKDGIPLPEAVITELVQLGDKLGVPFPSDPASAT